MKFRRLTKDELQELESEFVRFLAANTVTGEDWEKLKKEKPQKAEGLIDIFSDIVFEKIIAQVHYLEFKTPKDYKTFHCQEDKITLLGLRLSENSDLDFTQNESLDSLMQKINQNGAQLQMYSAEKAYKPDRESEIFRMMNSGALISKDGAMFKTLLALKEQNQKG